MGKSLFIAEKPSVAQEFAGALKCTGNRRDGYLESGDIIVTWCVGHLVTMSYPDAYDPALKRWSLQTLPFLPKDFKYEVIESVKKQFDIVKRLLTRPDVETIYICTDSGREGEYIYRLVDQMARVPADKKRLRVWIDSQTEEEILRGIREAKDWSEYDNLSASAYLRAKEDYLMGINFSRLLTLRFGPSVSGFLRQQNRTVLSVGRVMTCVLGMVVRREREIRDFVKTPFYRVTGSFLAQEMTLEGEWRSAEGSAYFRSPKLYKENGFLRREDAQELVDALNRTEPRKAVVGKLERRKESKNPPLLYNLAELQNDCSRMFKISPDETLRVVQELYEKKLVTYPRTDARVLSSAVAKEIQKNLSGLENFAPVRGFAAEILKNGACRGLAKTRYVNDKQITDHYAIIPTGQGFHNLRSLNPLALKIYEAVARRFLSIFYPAAVYRKYALELLVGKEHFFANFRVLAEPGYLRVADVSGGRKHPDREEVSDADKESEVNRLDLENPAFLAVLESLKKHSELAVNGFCVREGETSPPRRYSSGSMILAMENAGQLIEDEELRAQIRGSGIGTSATRAEILKKLVTIKYLALNGKTQIITPTLLGELVYEVVFASIRPLLNPELTASWEKGLTYVSEGSITPDEYMEKLEGFVSRRTAQVLRLGYPRELNGRFEQAKAFYGTKDSKKTAASGAGSAGGKSRKGDKKNEAK